MPTFPLPSPRATLPVALVAFALAATVVVADSGPNQAAHHALVRSLASGTAEIDPGETIDASYVDGKYYAAKAPGLALFTLPWYGGLRAAGLQDGQPATEAGYRHRLWALNLWGAVLPMLVLLLLMVIAAERVAPGYGLPLRSCSRADRSCSRSRRSSSTTSSRPPSGSPHSSLSCSPASGIGTAGGSRVRACSPGLPSWPSSRSGSSPSPSGRTPRSAHGLLDG